jgi:serine/threonine protein kinase
MDLRGTAPPAPSLAAFPIRPAVTSGDTVAGYRVEALVGRGGMGVVYRATDLSLERPVALKLIAPELAEKERFLREPRFCWTRSPRSTVRAHR